MGGLLLIAFSLPLLNLGMSLGQFTLLGGWLFMPDLSLRIKNLLRNRVFYILLALFVVHLLGLAYTSDMAQGLKDVRIKLPLFLLPFLIGSGIRIREEHLRKIIYALMAGILTATFLGIYNRYFSSDEVVHDYRELSVYISHIRLSLLIDFSLVAVVWYWSRTTLFTQRLLLVVYALWTIAFLALLQSLTGFFLLGAISLAGACVQLFRPGSPLLKWFLVVVLSTIVIAFAYCWHTVFIASIQPVYPKAGELKGFTPRGYAYEHNLQSQQTERGKLVWINYAVVELDSAWKQRSRISLWETSAGGNMPYVTLMRYLTWKEYSKDADGVSRLTQEEIQDIEDGYPTPEHRSRANDVLFRLQQLADEYRIYHFEGYASGHTLAQRLEYQKTALWVVKSNWLTGVGTGDVQKAMQEGYVERKTQLEPRLRLGAHNQFLSLIMAFGIAGLLIVLLLAGVMMKSAIAYKDLLLLGFTVLALGSFLSEDTLETQAGATFFAFLSSVLLLRQGDEE